MVGSFLHDLLDFVHFIVQVQSVNTVEEMRITDLDMQHRWTTLERNTATLQIPDTNEVHPHLQCTYMYMYTVPYLKALGHNISAIFTTVLKRYWVTI